MLVQTCLEQKNNADEIDPKDKNKDDSESVFQKVLEDLDPPIMKNMENQGRKEQ